MADKDEFKIDEDGGFPEADLSEAFSEGEQTAPDEPEYPMTIKKSGNSKTRLLLLLLLLVVAAGGGYYSFMMNEPEPSPPPRPPKKMVAVPKPPSAPAATAQPTPVAGNSVQGNVPAPAPVQPTATAANPAPAAVKPSQTSVSLAPPPKAAAPAAIPAPVSPPAPTPPPSAVALPTATPEAKVAPASLVKPSPARGVPAITGGPWLVEAGTYLNVSALKSAEKKIRALGYEPQVTTTQKSVRMTRLRLGSFRVGEVKEALAYARGVAPDAFALRAGETFTVYAGTFTSAQNIRQMSERLTSEGLRVEEEPVDVKRTISLIRFGGFDDQATAAEVAARARKAGLTAGVVNPR